MNKVVLIGRMVRDAELKYTQSGAAVSNFTLAVDRKFSKEREADFINCVAWNKTAEFVAQYFSKGQQMALEGHLQVSSYEVDGQKRYKTEVVADGVEFCGGKKDNQQEDGSPFGLGETITFDEQDLPF